MSKKMHEEMFKNCRDYLQGRLTVLEFWETQKVHEEIVFGKQLPLFGGREDEMLILQSRERKDAH